ncbi:MAG: signal recognition particle protein [Rickettsiales bacterium]|jgi:signal recognition particle subunit SRP54|nr:signal recognition particle protein [Rickettsiales bacterium]
MFGNLTRKISGIFSVFSSSKITEEVLEKALREIKIALIEADTALPVVKSIMDEIKEKVLGTKAIKGVDRADYVIKVVNDAIKEKLGEEQRELNISKRPSVIMMVGLQGSGKTTTAGKLAYYLKEKKAKKVLLASTDIYRPQARQQLEILAQRAGVESLPIVENEKVEAIARRAVKTSSSYDVVIIDTAGRLQIDDAMMKEIVEVKKIANPSEIILCVDAVMGQESVNVAKAFNEALGITGIIMTRADGDARAGALLSMKTVSGASILFLGTGEKLPDLEVFHADRMAQRILGMGDIVTLVEQAQEKMDSQEVEKVSVRMMSGEFNFNDMLSQFQQMKKMGSMKGILKFIPGISGMMDKINQMGLNDDAFKKQEAIILSMTKRERENPKLLYLSRKERIAKGSGTKVGDVEALIKQYDKMKETMKKIQGMGGIEGMKDMMEKMKS